MRIDPANEILGLRVNVWVSLLVFVGAVAYLVLSARPRPGREAPEELLGDRAADSGKGEDGETTDHGEGRGERRRT